jgi:hypothetical protein
MFHNTKNLGWITLTLVAMFGSSEEAFAQFNPYVMEPFHPLAPAAPTTTPAPTTPPTTPIMPPYYSSYDSYYPNPYRPYGDFIGGALYGVAETYRAYGQLQINYEQARLLREQWAQAKLDTQRRRFELTAYLRANTPTYTEEQTRIARNTLTRIREHSTPAEISTGKALNLMLEDARKFPSRKLEQQQITLSEDILQQLNVTASFVGVGVLRNEGKINWPLALQELIPADQRKVLEFQAQLLVQGALRNKIDPSVYKDFSAELDRAYETLLKRVNELSGSSYLEAKRFLNELKDARIALEKGEAQHQAQYQRFVAGGRTIQDVVDFMINKGLRFAPATAQDEAAYRAVYAALAAYDVALNTQGYQAPPGKTNK